MIKRWLRDLSILVVALQVVPFHLAWALGTGGGPVTLPNPLGVSTFNEVLAKIITFLIEIAIPLTAIMALVGGFQMITAAGNPEKFATGRKTLMYAAIGFAVVVLAGGIVSIIKDLLGS